MLDNSQSSSDTTYAGTVDGVTTTEVVAGRDEQTITIPVTEGSTHTVLVEWDGNVLVEETFTVDCEQPAAVVTHDCTGYTVTLDNRASEVPVTFTVTVNGVSAPVEVPAGEQVVTRTDAVEDSSYDVSVAVGTTVLATATFAIDCVQPTAAAAAVTYSCTQ